jgi:hypothetical protein
MKSSLGTFAMSVSYLRVGEIDFQNDGEDNTYPEEGAYNTKDLLFMFSYAKTLGEKGAFGVCFKIHNQSIYNYSDSGFGMDMGVLYKPFNNFSFGTKIENLITPQIKLRSIGDDYPLNINVGGAYSLNGYGNIGCALNFDLDGNPGFRIGGEVKPLEMLYFASGYDFTKETVDVGFGVYIRGVKVEYGTTFNHDITHFHRIQLSYVWL